MTRGDSPTPSVLGVAGWLLWMTLFGFLLAFMSAMCADRWGVDRIVWIIGVVLSMGVAGLGAVLLVKVPQPTTRLVALYVGIFGCAVVILAWGWANESVTHGAIPPGPGQSEDDVIGWFSPRFWTRLLPSVFWALLGVIPYFMGVLLGRRIRDRRRPKPGFA